MEYVIGVRLAKLEFFRMQEKAFALRKN